MRGAPGLRPARRITAVLTTLVAVSWASARAETIYYQTTQDGSIRLTNAPGSPGYHTYMTTGRYTQSGPSFSGVRYADDIRRAARRFDVDPELVRAVIATESNFDPRAVSPKGARGLMQLMPATAARFGVKNSFDPHQNILGGVQYLRYLLDLFGGDLVLALAAYNAGEGLVQDLGRVPNFQETRNYVDRILTQYGRGGSRAGRAAPNGTVSLTPTASARSTRIYRTVTNDGVLVFTDSPTSGRPVRD